MTSDKLWAVIFVQYLFYQSLSPGVEDNQRE